MIKGYSHKPMGTVALGTHLGNFSKEDSLKYVEAIKYAVRNGIYSIDGAINYRGMCSERDEGVALAELREYQEAKTYLHQAITIFESMKKYDHVQPIIDWCKLHYDIEF